MPLFKRREKKDEREEEPRPEPKPSPEEEAPAPPEEEAPEEPEEGPSEEPLEAEAETLPPREEPGEVEDEDEEEGDELSIDDLIGDLETRSAMGGGDMPMEMETAIEGLAGEDVQLVKMAKKVVVIGDGAVGKTSLIRRFVQDVFDDRYLNTIGAKVMKKELGVNRPDTGEIVDLKLILWDIAGQETFNTVKKAYYRGASGAIVVCDCTRRETMEHMHRWIENLFDVSDVIPMVIIINKIDLEGEAQFSEHEVREDYAAYGASVFMTSAKSGDNVEMVFHELGKLISK